MPGLIGSPVDWQVVERLYGGRDAAVVAQLKRLGPLCARSRTDLASAIARGDWETAAREAHGMKGAVRMAGAAAAERAYADLESALHSGADVAGAHERADAEFRRLVAYMDTLVGLLWRPLVLSGTNHRAGNGHIPPDPTVAFRGHRRTRSRSAGR